MKVLLFNDLHKAGGTELQVLRELELLKANGHEVFLLTTDSAYAEGYVTQHHFNIKPMPVKKRLIFRYMHNLSVDRIYYKKFAMFFEKLRPDVIHINNVTCEPLAFYKALGSCRCKKVQTIRDCRMFCPTVYGINHCAEPCDGYSHHKCYKECKTGNRFRDWINDRLAYKLNKTINEYKKSYIDTFITPSQFLGHMAYENGFSTIVLNDMLDDGEIVTNIKNGSRLKAEVSDDGTKNYLCFGRICAMKGVMELIDAFEVFSKDKQVKLSFAGSIDEDIRERFEKRLSTTITYLGFLEHKKVLEELDRTYCVICPSIVLENYPNTILEGMARGCLCMGTERGGITELIDDTGLLFDVCDKGTIVDSLEYSYSMKEDKLYDYLEYNFKKLKKRNLSECYYKGLMEIFRGGKV